MFGQIPDFNDGFEFVRKMWGNAAGMPAGLMPGLSSMTPPMDLEEVDKRIQELKTVESWLQLNTNLLRTTIQGLEVQRATLVALKTFGNALSPEAMQSAMENVARAANAPSAFAFKREARPPEPARAAAAAHDPDAENNEDEDEPIPGQPPFEPERKTEAGTQAAAPQELPPQANLWWDMVQQQFNQIASTAAAASLASLGNMGGFGAAGAGDVTGSAQPASAQSAAGQSGTKRPAAKKAPASKAASAQTADHGGAKTVGKKPTARATGNSASKGPGKNGPPREPKNGAKR